MTSSDVSNDTRGWVLCVISAVACVAGACIVCVDVFIRLLPGKKNFDIQDSSAFLSASLSLSFGVMIFSSLFSMLPSSKRYLVRDGHSDQVAGLLMMAGFAVGFVGMQVISRIIHRFMPSHVVDCDHSHGEAGGEAGAGTDFDGDGDEHSHAADSDRTSRPSSSGAGAGATVTAAVATEATPLLAAGADHVPIKRPVPLVRRPSMIDIQNRVLSFVKDVKSNCDENGLCFGYSDPCGQECKRAVVALRTTSARPAGATGVTGATSEWDAVIPDASGTPATATTAACHHQHQHDPRDHEEMQEGDPETTCPPRAGESSTNVSHYGALDNAPKVDHACGHAHGHAHGHQEHAHGHTHESHDNDDVDVESGMHGHHGQHAQQQHHHHVPANAFLSIGLQTVLAIGLHKFPEGFITFATNHANPALGFNVFMALFVHNIAEGFAMALPLYMALGSRLKAILWAAALGGLSQPVGAGVAALWLQYLGTGGGGGGGGGGSADDLGTAYGVLFAVTAGIMVAVALQLFVESLTLHHNRQLAIGFAFVGMMMLGLSNAIGSH